ncbi:HPr family phosphocarrier protein [Thalassotalea ganghwensis]
MTRFERDLKITNKLGLHARAATKLAQLSQKFSATITVALDDKSVDASSIMGLMLLAGSKGKVVKVITEGDDAEIALKEVCQLFNDKFNEAE